VESAGNQNRKDGNIRKPSKSFRDLIVWQKAHEFVLQVYRMTKQFPKEEIYGLASQFRRAAVSIASNIAEGYRKSGVADKLRYMNIAQGSADECAYFLILTDDLGYADVDSEQDLLDEVCRLLTGYMAGIKNRNMY
jgi:four helix bundle protein